MIGEGDSGCLAPLQGDDFVQPGQEGANRAARAPATLPVPAT